MDIVGDTEFAYDEESSMYSFQWSFGGKSLEEFIIFNELNSTYAAATHEIKFQLGVLASVDNYMKFFVDSSGNVYAKICIGETKINENGQFTNCSLYKSTISLSANENNSKSKIVLPMEKLSVEERNKLSMKRVCKPQDITSRTHNQSTVFWYYCTKGPPTFWGYRYSNKDIIRRKKYICNLTFQIELFYRYWHREVLKTKTTEKASGVPLLEVKNAGKLDIKQYFLAEDFSDFKIKCGKVNFPVHKIILANKSPVFAKMFQQQFKEAQSGYLAIEDAEPQIVEEFLKFLYTGEAKLEENAAELIVIADKYSVLELKEITEKILISKVCEDNFLQLFTLGKLLSSENLTSKCFQVFKKKKTDLVKTTADIKKYSEEYPELMLKLSRGDNV